MLALMTAGCAQPDTSIEQKAPSKNPKRTICTDPRPQMCTREYRPVCATLQDGTRKTYATGCTACADSKVVSHIPAPCEY